MACADVRRHRSRGEGTRHGQAVAECAALAEMYLQAQASRMSAIRADSAHGVLDVMRAKERRVIDTDETSRHSATMRGLPPSLVCRREHPLQFDF